MTDSPQPDDQNTDHPTSVSNVSGGVNVDANEVTIGGDAVGRDKISSTQSTDTGGGANIGGNVAVSEGGEFVGRDKIVNNIRQFILSPWGLIGLAMIFAVTALIITGVIKLPAPLAFPPATEDQSLIIVADFEDRSGGKYQGIDPAQYIYEQLTAQAKKDNLDVRIERLRHTVDDNTVRSTGETYSATLVLWGWYDALAITPRLERIKTRSEYRSSEEGKHFSLADPTKMEFSIVTDLPNQGTYIGLLMLGLDVYDVTIPDYDKALTYFSSAIGSIPTNVTITANPAESYFFRGNVYGDKGDYDRAIVDYNWAIRLRPDFAEAYNNRGLVYFEEDDYDRALADFDKAIELRPTLAEAYAARGGTYSFMGNFDRALADFDKAIQLKSNFTVYIGRGSAFYLMGNFDSALADYDKAIQLKPDSADAYIARGVTYDSIGDYDRAIADYNQAVQLKPDYAKPFCARGVVYQQEGEKEKAIADYKKCIDLSDDPQLSKAAQDQLNSLGAQ